MIVLISGATHTGKTALSQRLMEEYKIPYYSIDHLKMGLIRSGQTALTVTDDKKLVPYLWSVVKEIIKTAVENNQSLIIEGCYIPFDWQTYFEEAYLREIKYYCLIMTEEYIVNNFDEIISHENAVERRISPDELTKSELIADNNFNLEQCKKYNLTYILIDKFYEVNLTL